MTEPDYQGFVEHYEAWEEVGVAIGWNDLGFLAKKYNTPIPKFKDGELIW